MYNHRPLFVMLIVIFLLIQPGGMQRAYAGTFTNCANVTQIPVEECDALVALYNSTNGVGWTNHTNWLVTDTPGDWFGVTLINIHVLYLELNGNNLIGTIPPELENLAANLHILDFNNNKLTGTIPPQLGNIKDLNWLYLEKNQISGSIPPELGDLTNLRILDLANNQFSGSIPPQIGNLSYLEQLYLGTNQLSGSIPPELGNLHALKIFYTSFNQLSGSIPPQLGNLANLQKLGLSYNQLNGSLPPQLSNILYLDYLSLTENKVSGSIPLSFTALTHLVTFYGANTWLCDPQNSAFQAWTSTVTDWNSPGLCSSISGNIMEGANPLAGVTISDDSVHSATSGTDGTYTLTDLPPHSYILTPAFASHVFTPPTRSVTIINASISVQDFHVAQQIYLPTVLRN
jgi:hypothetical protein